MKKRILSLLLALAMFLVLCSCGSTSSNTTTTPTETNTTEDTTENHSVKFYSIVTPQLGGSTYNVCLAVATAANLGLSDIKVEALPTSGSVEVARMIRDNEAEMGSTDGYCVYMLKNGVEQFDGNGYEDVTVLFPQFTNYVNICVRSESDLDSIDDFAGKKVGIGNPGSIGFYMLQHIMRAYGMEADVDYTGMYLNSTDQTDNMSNKLQDVFGYYTTQNSSSVLQLAAQVDIRWISVDADVWYPYAKENGLPFDIVDGSIDNTSYEGMIEPGTQMMTGVQWIICRADASEDDVYQIVKSYFENIDTAVTMNATAGRPMDLLSTVTPAAQWHPGAIKYFEEAGIDYVPFEG